MDQSRLEYYPLDVGWVRVIDGGLSGLARFIDSQEWRQPEEDVVLLARNDLTPSDWLYVFDADEFRDRIEELCVRDSTSMMSASYRTGFRSMRTPLSR